MFYFPFYCIIPPIYMLVKGLPRETKGKLPLDKIGEKCYNSFVSKKER